MMKEALELLKMLRSEKRLSSKEYTVLLKAVSSAEKLRKDCVLLRIHLTDDRRRLRDILRHMDCTLDEIKISL